MIIHYNEMEQLNERIKVKMDIPQDIQKFHNLFNKSKHKLYVVGGAVRDYLLGKTPHDYDLVTDAQPDEVVHILKGYRTDIHGAKFGVVRVYTDTEPLGYEIATFRKDVSKGRNNKGNDQKVEIGKHITINDDVRRRDLTINALFYDLDTNEIVDAVSGIRDLKDNIIRAVGVPQKRFNEDRLRILRTIRFSAITGGKIDKLTSEAILKDNRLFGISTEDDVSRERIFAEFIKVKDKSKENNDPAIVTRFIDLLIDYNILSQIFPVLVTTKSISPTGYLTVALAETLRNNIPNDEFKKTLIDAKIPGNYVEIIAFLIKILRDGVRQDNVYEIYREMSSKNIRKDILAEWIRVMGISDDMVIGLLKYQPTTTGHEVMKDGFKGGQIGEEIKRREGIKYINMIRGVNEKNNILKFNQFKN
jgi:tRNA nucleotidyltransferase/poly(A) polymerase